MEAVKIRELLFDTYMKVQLDIYKRFGISKLVKLDGGLGKLKRSVDKEGALIFLTKLLQKDEEYLERFVEIEKDELYVNVHHVSETLSCFMV